MTFEEALKNYPFSSPAEWLAAAKEWEQSGIEVEIAKQWADAGVISVKNYKEFKERGLTHEHAALMAAQLPSQSDLSSKLLMFAVAKSLVAIGVNNTNVIGPIAEQVITQCAELGVKISIG